MVLYLVLCNYLIGAVMAKHNPPRDEHEHDHDAEALAESQQQVEVDHLHVNPFALCFFIILSFATLEFFGGIYTHSLALQSDAGHMLSDSLALGMAWFASHRAVTTQSKRYANGLTQTELVTSVINSVLMFGITIYIVYESIYRLQHPQNVTGLYVMVLAVFGVLSNLAVAKILHHHGTQHGGNYNLNHRAAFLHVLGDLLGAVAALVAGALIYFTGWLRADPILSLLISVIILIAGLRLARDIWSTLRGDTEKSHGHNH